MIKYSIWLLPIALQVKKATSTTSAFLKSNHHNAQKHGATKIYPQPKTLITPKDDPPPSFIDFYPNPLERLYPPPRNNDRSHKLPHQDNLSSPIPTQKVFRQQNKTSAHGRFFYLLLSPIVVKLAQIVMFREFDSTSANLCKTILIVFYTE